jgi:hypothetical protein
MENRVQGLDVRRDREARREGQRRLFGRNQAIGLLVVALGVLVYRLVVMPAGTLFPAGWWLLW